MLFNSVAFAVFLPIAFASYWLAGRTSHRLQNAILLVLSYVFYAWWDVRFLALIVLSSFTDYFVGLRMGAAKSRGERKALMGVSLAMNLGLLAVFKYLGFFAGQFGELLQGLGFAVDDVTLSILLPVGVSFYTFQTLSYTIDVYREQLEPERDMVAFFAFVAFFPQLVAGPIERASRLLPQIAKARRFDVSHAREGLRMMLWGLIAKVVIADNLAPIVDDIFATPGDQDSLRLLWGAVAFAFQIYGDFAGYSLIAIGVARLFGIELMWNFAYPYFSTSIADFWRRWHISLSSWFRDYVFIPLGGSRTTEPLWARNILVTFTVSGLWHGANWTFLMWGFLHGCYYLPTIARSRRARLAAEAGAPASGAAGSSGGAAVATKPTKAPARTGALHQLGPRARNVCRRRAGLGVLPRRFDRRRVRLLGRVLHRRPHRLGVWRIQDRARLACWIRGPRVAPAPPQSRSGTVATSHRVPLVGLRRPDFRFVDVREVWWWRVHLLPVLSPAARLASSRTNDWPPRSPPPTRSHRPNAPEVSGVSCSALACSRCWFSSRSN